MSTLSDETGYMRPMLSFHDVDMVSTRSIWSMLCLQISGRSLRLICRQNVHVCLYVDWCCHGWVWRTTGGVEGAPTSLPKPFLEMENLGQNVITQLLTPNESGRAV